MPRKIHKRTEEVFDANTVHWLYFLSLDFLFILLYLDLSEVNRELTCFETFHLLSRESQAHHKVVPLNVF